MDKINIISNILSNTEDINQCAKTLENININNVTDIELLHTSRYVALEKADFNNQSNITATLTEILDELNNITSKNPTNDNDDSSIVSLQLSSILDTILNNLSNNNCKIYIYRYFFMCSMDDLAALCDCSIDDAKMVLSSTNSALESELEKANIQCSSKTLLESFADIDNNYISIALGNGSIKKDTNNTATDNNSKGNLLKKIKGLSGKQIFNICFGVAIVVLFITAIVLYTSDTTKPASTSDAASEEISDSTRILSEILTADYGVVTVNIDKLLSYTTETYAYSGIGTYMTEHFSGTYYTIKLNKDVPLEACIGEKISVLSSDDMTQSCYKLLGSDSMKYIIQEKDGAYSLYGLEFINCNVSGTIADGNLSLYELTSEFYGLSSSADINKIYVSDEHTLANYDDLFVKKLINEPDDLSNIFSGMIECKYNIDATVQVMNGVDYTYDYFYNNSVQLIIELYDGTIIDSLYYRPGDYYIFDSNLNIAFNPDAVYADLLSDMTYDESMADEIEIIQGESSEEIKRIKINKIGRYFDAMFSFPHHKRESIPPEEWAFSTNLIEVDNTTISISFMQSNQSNPIDNLYYNGDHTIEKLENNVWSELPYNATYLPDETLPFVTSLNGSAYNHTLTINFRRKYDTLTAGKYRLGFKIYDGNSEDINNPISKTIYVEFELSETDLN